jgi:hypothetical protein
VRRGNETALITLKKVVYILRFIINIFSLSCCKKLHFNSKTNKLFKEDESKIFSDLIRVGGHWFLDAQGVQDAQDAQDTGKSCQAMTSSSTQAKPSQVITIMRAHQLLSHLSY